MLFILYRIGKFLALHLPMKAGYWLAGLFSSLYYYFSKNDRYAVINNLKTLFPDYDYAALSGMAKEVFVNFGKYLMDFFRFSKIDKVYIDKYVKIEGLENLKNALKEKRGAIAVTAHLGSWELGGAVISTLGFPFAAVVLNHKDKNVNYFFVRQRELKGIEVIPVGLSLRRCFSALASNHVLALVGDRDYFDNGIEMEFFGKKTLIPKGPALFSRRCGSPIVPTFVIRNKDDTCTLRFYSPIKPLITDDRDHDLFITTKKITQILQEAIKEYPTQWCVFRRFWERIGWGR